MAEKSIQGIGIGKKVALGRAYHYVRSTATTVRKQRISNTAQELERLSRTVDHVKADLSRIAEKLKTTDEHSAEIMLAQMEFLDDPGYIGEIEKIIQNDSINAEAAVETVCNTLVEEFMAIDDEYFRERASDIKDLSSKIIADVSGHALNSLADIDKPSIVIAEDLLPSDTAQIDPSKVLGFCTEKGTATSHTALLAKSFGIPAVIGCGTITVQTGETVIVNAAESQLIINPSKERIETAEQQIRAHSIESEKLIAEAQEPAITADGIRCTVLANIASAGEAEKAREFGAEGSGLLRSEFFFYQEDNLPSEDRQCTMYNQIANILSDSQITIRTLDIGGDKPLQSIQDAFSPEQNPFLGLRGIRLSNTLPQVFSTQLRAIIRAAQEKNTEFKIMFPFITTVGEVQELRKTFEACHKQLEEDYGQPFIKPKIGVMIEIPSAALMIDSIVKYVDFVSIGTNDLTQYTCAVDRTNEAVSSLADYCNPAVIRLVNIILQSKTQVSICGEMAGDPLLIPLLYGMGLSHYSMAAEQIPPAKNIFKKLHKKDCEELVGRCLSAEKTSEIRSELEAFASKHHTH